VQSARLKELRSHRDAAAAAACLENIRKAAIANTNLMPEVIHAVENHCTLGEIADELRKIFGEYRG
jgi:methylmalonyl-CoA mutase N-terminal domain/subunit